VLEVVGIFTNHIKVRGNDFITVLSVHLHGIRSLVLVAPVAAFESVHRVRPPDFGALKGLHHSFASCTYLQSKCENLIEYSQLHTSNEYQTQTGGGITNGVGGMDSQPARVEVVLLEFFTLHSTVFLALRHKSLAVRCSCTFL
jgi:hypothetical protein